VVFGVAAVLKSDENTITQAEFNVKSQKLKQKFCKKRREECSKL